MSRFTPQNEQFESRVRESFTRQRIMQTIGAVLTHVGPGEVTIELPYREDLTQQHGFLHAGIVATILDSACGYAAFSLMPATAGVLSIEFKINMMAPSKGDRVVATAGVLRAGRTITVCAGKAVAYDEDREREVAHMQATMMTIRERGDVVG